MEEAKKLEALILARTAARAAASSDHRTLAIKMAERRASRPASAALTQPNRIGPDQSTKRPASAAPRAKIAAAREAAKKLLANAGKQKVRTPWGFFQCEMLDDGHSLKVVAPAILSSAVDSEAKENDEDAANNAAEPPAAMPDVTLARPINEDEKRLAFGPFAFRLSPSSEVLTWLACTALRPHLQGKAVLELGSGLGFTGLSVAAWCDCASVRLTDGDPSCVTLLDKAIQLNKEGFGSTRVDHKHLLWGDDGYEVERLYDVIVFADCVYDRSLHLPLCATIKKFLKPQGCAVGVNSRRCGSLRDFERCAHQYFALENWGSHYDMLTTSLLQGKKCFPEVISLRHKVRRGGL